MLSFPNLVLPGSTPAARRIIFGSPPPISTSVFTPAQVSGLYFWLRADSISAADGTAIGTWPDMSGNGRNATQATGANQPLYKVNIINGKPVIRFDGVNDTMTISSVSLASFTAFYIFKGSGGILCEHSINSNSNDGDYVYLPGANSTNIRRASSVTAYDSYPVAIGGSTLQLLMRRFAGNNNNHTFRCAGVMQYRASPVSSTALGGSATADYYIAARAGTSLFSTVDIAEIIMYNTALSAANWQKVTDYLGAKYAIAVNYA